MKLFDWQCPVCFLLVEDVADTDDQRVKHVYCERCKKEQEFIRLPGGHPDATAAAKWREGK